MCVISRENFSSYDVCDLRFTESQSASHLWRHGIRPG